MIDERQRFKDHTYLEMARLQARLSKDPSTHVGAVVLDRRGVVKGTGYNGFARGVEDAEGRLDDREVKLMLTRHAEPNALWAAGPDAEGGTIYVTHHPCARCAADIVQHGVVRVVIPEVDDLGVRWAEDRKWAKVQFEDAGVEVVEI
jgi:dCMP deaminase